MVWPLAQIIGTAAFAASPGARDAVRANLGVVSPAHSGATTVRHIFAEQARNYLDIFRLVRMDRDSLRAEIGRAHV